MDTRIMCRFMLRRNEKRSHIKTRENIIKDEGGTRTFLIESNIEKRSKGNYVQSQVLI